MSGPAQRRRAPQPPAGPIVPPARPARPTPARPPGPSAEARARSVAEKRDVVRVELGRRHLDASTAEEAIFVGSDAFDDGVAEVWRCALVDEHGLLVVDVTIDTVFQAEDRRAAARDVLVTRVFTESVLSVSWATWDGSVRLLDGSDLKLPVAAAQRFAGVTPE